MKTACLEMRCRITPMAFREFAYYNTFVRQKQYRSPALFAAIMSISASICFSQIGRLDQAALIGSVLLAVGLGLPVAYLLSFFSSVRTQEKRLVAEGDSVAYTVRLAEDRFTVTMQAQEKEYPWKNLVFACRLRHGICLYADQYRAYLLPCESLSQKHETLWERVTSAMPKKKSKCAMAMYGENAQKNKQKFSLSLSCILVCKFI